MINNTKISFSNRMNISFQSTSGRKMNILQKVYYDKDVAVIDTMYKLEKAMHKLKDSARNKARILPSKDLAVQALDDINMSGIHTTPLGIESRVRMRLEPSGLDSNLMLESQHDYCSEVLKNLNKYSEQGVELIHPKKKEALGKIVDDLSLLIKQIPEPSYEERKVTPEICQNIENTLTRIVEHSNLFKYPDIIMKFKHI